MRISLIFLLALMLVTQAPKAEAQQEIVLIDVQRTEYFTTGTAPYLHYPLGFLNRGVVLKATLHVNVGHTSLVLAERHLPVWAKERDHNLAVYPFNNTGTTQPYNLTFPRPIPADDRYVFVVFTGAGGAPQVLRLRIIAKGLRPISELTPSVVAQVVQNLTQVQTNIVNLQQNITRIENNVLQLNHALTQVAGDLVKVGNGTVTVLKEVRTTNVTLEQTFGRVEGSLTLFSAELGVGVTLLAVYLGSKLVKGRKSR